VPLTLLRQRPEFAVLPGVALAVHLCTWHGYGWFRDELYYVACARHLAWGYVDHPPLSIAILRVVIDTFGASLHAIRTVPAIAGAITVALVGLVARELGGGRFACLIAMTAAVAAPESLAIDFFYSMNAFDLLAWPAIALALLVALRTGGTRSWVCLGVLLGLGLLNKVSVLWLGAGIAAGLVLTPYRQTIGRRGLWLAAALAAVLLAPHVAWQVLHGWPTLEFMRNASGTKMAGRGVLTFAIAAISDEGVVVVIVGLAGLAAAFAGALDRRARVVAWAFVVVFLILALNGTSRTGYLTPAWTWTFALGGLALERAIPDRRMAWRIAAAGAIGLFGVVALPMALPVLPTERYVRYAAALGQGPSTEENKQVGRLPQFYADMNGWDSIVASLEAAWRTLPADEQARALFFGTNYGEAGAVDVLGRARGLPPAFATHNNYFFWGPPGDDIDAVVIMSQNPARWSQSFDHVVLAGETDCGDCMPYENHRQIYVVWGRHVAWADLWPALRHFD
jgi:hypothetical protein